MITSTVAVERVLLIVTKQLVHVLLVMFFFTENVKMLMNVWSGHVTVQPYAKIIQEALFVHAQMV